MTIKAYITNRGNNRSADVDYFERCDCNALNVATIPRMTYYTKPKPFTNPTYGNELAQDASGTYNVIEEVHNGEDDVLWTATTVVGNAADFDFNSTDQAHTGTQSINCENSEGGDTFQLADTVEHESGDYNIFAGWVYVTGLWTLPDDGVNVYLWNTTSGTQASTNSIDLDDYIDGTDVDVWQRFVVQMSDFGNITSFDAVRFQILEDGAPPDFYLDDIQFETTATSGSTLEYSIEPSKGTWLYVTSLTFRMVDDYDSTLINASMPNIPYDGLLGLSTLDSGILYQQINNGVIENSFVIRDFIDIMNNCFTQLTGYGSDGTNTWVSVNTRFCEPVLLKADDEDKLRFIINDDLSGLISLRISAECKEDRRLL